MGKINLLLVFVEGLLSFFSPCILPILPIYLGILSSSSIESLREGRGQFINSTLLKNTILFILGISSTFFILGSSVGILKQFLISDKKILMLIGGMLIVIMGMLYMGYLNLPFLQKERKFQISVNEMKPLTAYLLGFTFSFGWTPCVGPMLASVLIMASSSSTRATGNLMIMIYTIGFTIPFIVLAIFYSKLFKFLDSIKHHMKTIQKLGGAILIISGLVMAMGGYDKAYDYLKRVVIAPIEYVRNDPSKPQEKGEVKPQQEEKLKAPDFSLVDQYGNTHKLSNYKGKVIFLNFWATWCPPCRGEMPHIEEIYKEFGDNKKEVIILGIAAPNLGKETSKEGIIDFLKKNKYTFPVAFDTTGELMDIYSISAFPTTFIIDKEGNVKQYAPGALDKVTMEQLIKSVE